MIKNLFIPLFKCVLVFSIFISVPSLAQEVDFPSFGKDIPFNDIPSQNQKLTATCTAFNGWIYAVYTYYNPLNDHDTFVFLRSEDDGLTWNFLSENAFVTPDARCVYVKLFVTGSTTTSLKIIFGSFTVSSGNLWGDTKIYQFDGNTGVYEKVFISKFSTTMDFLYPNPYDSSTFAVVNPENPWNPVLHFYHTINGGFSFKDVILATSTNLFHNNRLAFGNCDSDQQGKFYAIWEDQDEFDSIPGRIYTAHTFGDTSFTFSQPVRLDILEPGAAEMCSEPVIACQNNFIDNNLSDITEIVFFTKEAPLGEKRIVGYKNLSSTSDTIFTKISLPDSISETEQPEVIYSPYDSSFYLTYYNKTIGKIPLFISDLNMNGWGEITNGYNDDAVPSNPFARITANEIDEQIMCSWTKKYDNTPGVALYDSQKSTYNAVESKDINKTTVSVFPNPCSGITNIIIKPAYKSDANLDIYDISGKKIISLYQNESLIFYKINLSDFPSGIYIYNIKTLKENLIGKIVLKKY